MVETSINPWTKSELVLLSVSVLFSPECQSDF